MEQHRAINKALRLEVGDHIWFTYAGKSQLSAKELKRLSGWTRNMRYVGEVVMLPADRYNPDGQLGVRLADVQTGKHQCTHNGINGRYCHVLNAYVEQTTEPRCKEQKVLTSKQQTEK